jgi:hypothetical protein
MFAMLQRFRRIALWNHREAILRILRRDAESADPAHPRQAKRRRRPSRAPPQRDLRTIRLLTNTL